MGKQSGFYLRRRRKNQRLTYNNQEQEQRTPRNDGCVPCADNTPISKVYTGYSAARFSINPRYGRAGTLVNPHTGKVWLNPKDGGYGKN